MSDFQDIKDRFHSLSQSVPKRYKVSRSGKNIKGYGFKCQELNCKNEAIHKHHIDGNKKNNDESNFKYLCGSCHKKNDSRKWEYGETAATRSRDLVDDFTRPVGEKIRYAQELCSIY